MDEPIDVDALFLGPRSENRTFMTEAAAFLLDEHVHWRRDFHPEDPPAIDGETRRSARFGDTLDRTEEVLLALSAKLKQSSDPWFSPRYLGHMNSDTLMVANLAYMATILYNPNNVAYEASPVTTELELEAGKQLAAMLGFDADTAWGHITADGSIANYEAFWVARNLASIPKAIKQIRPDLVDGLDDWQLLNVTPRSTLDLVDELSDEEFESVRDRSVRGIGVDPESAGKLLVPQSKHYSWTKAADILGLGQDAIIEVPVTQRYRMDIDALRATIDDLVAQRIPILGVVSVVGTTEEGAVDELHRIVDLRDAYEREGVSFYLHVDAAYGGYTRTLLLDGYGELIPFGELSERLHDLEVIADDIDWPEREVYDAYAAMGGADSVTVDPHKMGYVPYAAGAVAMKDSRSVRLVSYFAAYVFEATGKDPMLLGSYIMEGSKAGAAAASVWAANQTIPLNVEGYGRIIGRGIEGAARLYEALDDLEPFEVGGRMFQIEPLVRPDFNIVDYAFNEVGNTSLETMNKINSLFYSASCYEAGPLDLEDFITSKTELSRDAYGDVPRDFVVRLGIPESEWDRTPSVYVLRSCVLSPWLTATTSYQEYWARYIESGRKRLAQIVSEL